MCTTVEELVTDATSRAKRLSPAQVEAHLYAEDAVVIDVRETEEVAEQGRIVGAVHIPRGVLEFRADVGSPSHRPELDPARRTIVYSAAGGRAALAARSLEDLGYRDVALLEGGIQAWKQQGYTVVSVSI